MKNKYKLGAILVLSVGMLGAAQALQTLPPNLGPQHGPTAAPEIDPSGAFGAASLLLGTLAVVRGRQKRK